MRLAERRGECAGAPAGWCRRRASQAAGGPSLALHARAPFFPTRTLRGPPHRAVPALPDPPPRRIAADTRTCVLLSMPRRSCCHLRSRMHARSTACTARRRPHRPARSVRASSRRRSRARSNDSSSSGSSSSSRPRSSSSARRSARRATTMANRRTKRLQLRHRRRAPPRQTGPEARTPRAEMLRFTCGPAAAVR